MNPYLTISQKRYLAAAQVFHCAYQEHFTLWFTGEWKRSKRTEVILPRLVKKGLLVCVKHGKKKVYVCPRKARRPGFLAEVYHGLNCTEGLIRCWWSDMKAEIIEERFFYGCGSIPEWGLRYQSGKMLLFEYCTEDNFSMATVMKGKLYAYRQNLERINGKFNRDGIIVFVCDVPRQRVLNFIERLKPMGLPVFFTDSTTFKAVTMGYQLTAPIYLWGEDGNSYPLTNHAQPTHT